MLKSHILVLSMMTIPVTSLKNWKTESFSRGTSHQIESSEKGLRIQVKNSASPLFYPFKSQQVLKSFHVTGEFTGLPVFKNVSLQGTSGFDDYPFRIGIIAAGLTKFEGFKKLMAPEWLKNLFKNLPLSSGLDKVYFFNVTQDPLQVGTTRKHPSSDLIEENFIKLVEKPGAFDVKYTFNKPINTLGIWISIDGDDTKSNYDVILSKIEFETP